MTFTNATITSKTADIPTAAVEITLSNSVVLDDNLFKNVAQGVLVQGASGQKTIAGNNFLHIWSSAIHLRPGTSQNLITNNSIDQSDEMFGQLAAIQLIETLHNQISHNFILNVAQDVAARGHRHRRCHALAARHCL